MQEPLLNTLAHKGVAPLRPSPGFNHTEHGSLVVIVEGSGALHIKAPGRGACGDKVLQQLVRRSSQKSVFGVSASTCRITSTVSCHGDAHA
eukprot:m.33714 g.33714  ORF g.33714 m.33714 type:complete len:91 (+) comp9656_c0_seq2:1674-1946(+)